jgi:hypothetical protein
VASAEPKHCQVFSVRLQSESAICQNHRILTEQAFCNPLPGNMRFRDRQVCVCCWSGLRSCEKIGPVARASDQSQSPHQGAGMASKLRQTKAQASSEPYTHLIGLGDFPPEGATEISPGASEAQPGVWRYGLCALQGAQEHLRGSVQRPSGARLFACV